MAYDVASSINELLFENNSVIIPGFGGFELSKQSASIDHIKSTLTPPAQVPKFNKNLTVNDGILVDYIKNQNRCTLEQAQKIVNEFVAEVEGKIEKKEIIEFPKVGRIYKDYSKSLQFLPYEANFNTKVFGLPTVEVHPFSRKATPSTATATTGAAAAASDQTSATQSTATSSKISETVAEKIAPKVAEKKLGEGEKVAGLPLGEKPKGVFRLTQMAMPLLILASVILIAASFFILRKSDSKVAQAGDNAMVTNDNKKINTAPSIEDADIISLPEDTESDASEVGNFTDPSETGQGEEVDYSFGEKSGNRSTAGASNTFGDNECVVIVGQFSSKSNAQKLADGIENAGYESYQGWNDEKAWNIVGVKFTYESESEKKEMLQELRKKYDQSAWILNE